MFFIISFFLDDKHRLIFILKYRGLFLSRTRKGPTNLFVIEKVQDRENYRKNQNFY